jgi:hypothetical protein
LHEAAAASVAAREYSDTLEGRAEREADLAAAESDVVAAVLALADPALMIGDDSGVEPVTDACEAAPCDEHGRPLFRLPDFATLFSVCECGRRACDRCQGYRLTSRTAAPLYVSAHALAHAGYDDVDEHGDDTVAGVGEWTLFDQFPPITFRRNAVSRRQAARACDDLADDLEAGQLPEPRCPAEEMALRLMISSAEAMVHDDHEFVVELVASPHIPRTTTGRPHSSRSCKTTTSRRCSAPSKTGSRTRTPSPTGPSAWATTVRRPGSTGSIAPTRATGDAPSAGNGLRHGVSSLDPDLTL